MQQGIGEIALRLCLRDKFAFYRVVQALRRGKSNLFNLLHLIGNQENPPEDGHLARIKTKQTGPLGQGKPGSGRRCLVSERSTNDLLPESFRHRIRGFFRAFTNGQDVVVINEVARIGRADVGADQAAEQIDLVANRAHQRHGILAMPGCHLGVFVGRQGAQRGTGDQDENPGKGDQYAEKGFAQVHLTKT